MLVNIKINTLPSIHIVDRYLHTVSSLGVVNDNQGLDYFSLSTERACEFYAAATEDWTEDLMSKAELRKD
jgi:hypothetical protein